MLGTKSGLLGRPPPLQIALPVLPGKHVAIVPQLPESLADALRQVRQIAPVARVLASALYQQSGNLPAGHGPVCAPESAADGVGKFAPAKDHLALGAGHGGV